MNCPRGEDRPRPCVEKIKKYAARGKPRECEKKKRRRKPPEHHRRVVERKAQRAEKAGKALARVPAQDEEGKAAEEELLKKRIDEGDIERYP